MRRQPVEPEECLRSLTGEALLRARSGHSLLPDSLGVMATANAFVMLGLMAEHRAEEILADHRTALQAKGLGGAWGVNDGELTVRPGAHEYWTARGGSGELVSIRLYGHPWVMGEYWPMITPCFAVHATDDRGNSYQGMPGGWGGGVNHQGSGQFWFWPPVPGSCERLRVTVSTLWEAAWADIDLPGRTE